MPEVPIEDPEADGSYGVHHEETDDGYHMAEAFKKLGAEEMLTKVREADANGHSEAFYDADDHGFQVVRANDRYELRKHEQ